MRGDLSTQRKFAKRLKNAGLTTESGRRKGLVIFTPDGQRLGEWVVQNPHSVMLAEKELAALGYVIP